MRNHPIKIIFHTERSWGISSVTSSKAVELSTVVELKSDLGVLSIVLGKYH